MRTVAVVSPHLDDAALSVGGLLWLLKDHYRVEVITVFSADPPDTLSPVAAEFAASFGRTISAVRRAEDERALTALGVGHRHLGFEDAIHRRTACGAWLVNDLPDLTGLPPEATLVEQVTSALAECLGSEPVVGLLSPAGIGNHVDHLVTAAAVRRTVTSGTDRLAWIDFPYGVTERREEPRLRVPLPEPAWRAKVAAISCYETQLDDLFPGWGNVDRKIRLAGGQAECFAVPGLDAQPELLSLLDDVLGCYFARS